MKKTNRGSIRTTFILVVVLIAGIAVILYPTFSDWWNSFHQTRAIASYVETVANLNTEEYERMFREAEEYNRRLPEKTNRYVFSDEDIEEYNAILDVTGTGIMGYVEIPSIGVHLPIYHGMDESVLQMAIGHLEGTSLPVGGIGTHAVITGHRGLPSAKLFTDLDQLKEGDHFLLQILDRTLTYEVDQIRIVTPMELQDLEIDSNQDYCTLITCTPYGINTHRLLVRGVRVENDEEDIDVVSDALQMEPVIVAPLVAAPILLMLVIVLLALTSRKSKDKRLRDRQEIDKLIKKLDGTRKKD